MKLTRDKISKLRRVKNQSYRRFHRKKNTDVTTTTFRKNNRAIEQLFKTVKHYVDKKFIEKHKKERIRKRLLKLQKQLGGGDKETGTGTGTGTGTFASFSYWVAVSQIQNMQDTVESQQEKSTPISRECQGACGDLHINVVLDVAWHYKAN